MFIVNDFLINILLLLLLLLIYYYYYYYYYYYLFFLFQILQPKTQLKAKK